MDRYKRELNGYMESGTGYRKSVGQIQGELDRYRGKVGQIQGQLDRYKEIWTDTGMDTRRVLDRYMERFIAEFVVLLASDLRFLYWSFTKIS